MTLSGRVSSLRVQSHFHHTLTTELSLHPLCPKHTLFKEPVLAAAWDLDQQAKSREPQRQTARKALILYPRVRHIHHVQAVWLWGSKGHM